MSAQRTQTVSRAIEDAATIGALQAQLEIARRDLAAANAKLAMANQAAGVLDAVFDALDQEAHQEAAQVYAASCLARGYRFEREAA